MKKRLSPQEKKELAYKRDHYVSGGESRHAFRKNWPKKKAMLNQKHRHRSDEMLHRLEKLGDFASIESSAIEATADQLRKADPREKLFKWGVHSLKEYVETNQKKSEDRATHNRRNRELITKRCTDLVQALERDSDSPRARTFLREVELGGGWGWDFSMFLRWYPEWRPRLQKAWSAVMRVREKAARRQQNKETQKHRAKLLRKAAQNRGKAH
jgi:hypothetical protein